MDEYTKMMAAKYFALYKHMADIQARLNAGMTDIAEIRKIADEAIPEGRKAA